MGEDICISTTGSNERCATEGARLYPLGTLGIATHKAYPLGVTRVNTCGNYRNTSP